MVLDPPVELVEVAAHVVEGRTVAVSPDAAGSCPAAAGRRGPSYGTHAVADRPTRPGGLKGNDLWSTQTGPRVKHRSLAVAFGRHGGYGPEMVSVVGSLLRASWEASAARLEYRCVGLTDREYLWCPVPHAWTIHPDPNRSDRWTYDYDFAPPPPAPVTSIAWRIVHLIADNEIYWEYAFGPGRRTFPDLVVPSKADDALVMWRASRDPITAWLETATDDDLLDSRPSRLGSNKTAGEVVRILLDEQTHHGAEIALLRDLFPRLVP
jgi:hypothetical protein